MRSYPPLTDGLIIGLDISTHTGWAFIRCGGGVPTLGARGTAHAAGGAGFAAGYPYSVIDACNKFAAGLVATLNSTLAEHGSYMDTCPSVSIVIEETNGSRSRYTQKGLEFLHFAVLTAIRDKLVVPGKCPVHLVYVNTSDWRRVTGCHLTADDKKSNAKLSKGKRAGKTKAEIGLKGKVTKKHVSVRAANERFGLSLKQKDNDQAEAILLGLAFNLGIDGTDEYLIRS
jgi:hypothetical protein